MTAAATLASPEGELASAAPPLVEAPRRVLSVDVLRGLTVAFMILVNDPGDWEHVFRQLDHAEWNGWTMTDCVFPTFLFLVGMSLVFSVQAAERRGNCRGTITGKLFGRAAKILCLDVVLTLVPRFQWHALRFYGVLSRIALCSLLAGLIFVWLRRRRWLLAVTAALLVGYWLLLRFAAVPGVGLPGRDIPFLDPTLNIVAWVDRGVVAWTQRWLHTGVLYQKVRDPEGFLSTFPAVATTLLGTLTALAMERFETRTLGGRLRMAASIGAAGAALMAAGELWSRSFPINKRMWTSSYVLLMAGIAMVLLAVCSVLMDDTLRVTPRLRKVLAWPWLVFGSNAIVAYGLSELLVKLALAVHVQDGPVRRTLLGWIYLHGFAAHGAHGSSVWTSLAFAIAFVALCFLPNWWLWRRRIFVKL